MITDQTTVYSLVLTSICTVFEIEVGHINYFYNLQPLQFLLLKVSPAFQRISIFHIIMFLYFNLRLIN